jgi:hypothetical protein
LRLDILKPRKEGNSQRSFEIAISLGSWSAERGSAPSSTAVTFCWVALALDIPCYKLAKRRRDGQEVLSHRSRNSKLA